ncbi:unnamed protein product, partial [Heterotrigona itama]
LEKSLRVQRIRRARSDIQKLQFRRQETNEKCRISLGRVQGTFLESEFKVPSERLNKTAKKGHR